MFVMGRMDCRRKATCSLFGVAKNNVVNVIFYVFNISGCANLRGNSHVSRSLEEVREGLRHWSCSVHTVFCICFPNNDTINNVGVEHFEDLDSVFTYHTLFCDWATALCPSRVRRMDGPHFRHIIHRCNIRNTLIHAN